MNDWNAQHYRQHTGFVSELGVPLVELLDPRAGERILDLGCGDGILTGKLVELGCEVVGIDSSPDMISAALERGVDVRLLDAVDLASTAELHGRFDAVFSNAALHWMHPMESVMRGVLLVLKPDGRFVAELGGKGNIDRIRAALHRALESRGISGREIDPWHFPSPREYGRLLTGVGFDIKHMEHFERPTELPTGIGDWVASVARPFLHAMAPDARRGFLSEVEDRLAAGLRRNDGTWWADYVRLRVCAVRRPAA